MADTTLSREHAARLTEISARKHSLTLIGYNLELRRKVLQMNIQVLESNIERLKLEDKLIVDKLIKNEASEKEMITVEQELVTEITPLYTIPETGLSFDSETGEIIDKH